MVGILALQGDFEKHQQRLSQLNISSKFIRKPEELKRCNRLIIPGGESTTMTKLMRKWKLNEAIKEFAQNHAVWGTCAGTILLANHVPDPRVEALDLIDIQIARNAYGTQVDSFIAEIDVNFLESSFKGVFIRAPKIIHCGQNVKSLSEFDDKVVMARNNNVLVSTFHPELTQDTRIHEYFLKNF